MARPRTVNPQAVADFVRADNRPAAAAKEFNISRVRVSQILAEVAPELLPTRLKPQRTRADEKAAGVRRRRMIAETKKALKENVTHAAAARALGLTASGLYHRKRRFGLPG